MWDIQGLSVRSCNVLKSTNVGSDTELLDAARSMTEKEFDAELLKIDMCGRKSLNEIKDYCLRLEPSLWGKNWLKDITDAVSVLDGPYIAPHMEKVVRLLVDEVIRLRTIIDGR